MEAGVVVVGVVAFLMFAFVVVGGPALLTDRIRNRRQEAIRRQIALTDALDAECGPVVAPVVKQSLWGPLRVEIAVPFARPETVGEILAVAHKALSVAEGMEASRYRIVLAAAEGPIRARRETLAHRSPERWSADGVAAA